MSELAKKVALVTGWDRSCRQPRFTGCMELNSLGWCLLADGHASKHAGDDIDFRVTPDGLSSRVEGIRPVLRDSSFFVASMFATGRVT